jgi:hypothetical protein
MKVDAALATAALTVGGLRAGYRSARATNDQARIKERDEARASRSSESIDALNSAARLEGVPAGLLIGMAKIESNLDASAKNGSSRGLLQFQPDAWDTASRYVKGLGPYDKNVWDPYQNARAGAGLLKANLKRLGTLGYPGSPSAAVLYLAHQQGADGFMELHNAANGVPPGSHPKVSAKHMSRNPPPDVLVNGKWRSGPVTTDPAEFYKRWMAVAERKLGNV